MQFIADLHLHSKYSRATSKEMDVENLERWAQIKGIAVIGTGDFTHPEWFQTLKEKLEPSEQGLFKLKGADGEHVVHFMLTSEVSCIYSKGGKVRKIHILIFSPSFEICEKINTHLGWIGNLAADGRPILGLDAKELMKIVLDASDECLFVPAHAFTPWFGLFGSKSGFDSIEECFEDYSQYIYAIETGLSATPSMCWRLSALDNIALISNGDCHSLRKIGREANVFDTDVNYPAIARAIKSKDPKEFLYTIEFFPEEGKYHYDGHRACETQCSPEETKKYNGLCPVCRKPLTVGVMSRVDALADRPEGVKPAGAIPFKSLIPLGEIIAEAIGRLPAAKQVDQEYHKLISNFGNEFAVLLHTPQEELKTATLPEIAEGIKRVREGKVQIDPGYDGVYGKVHLFSPGNQKVLQRQGTLF